MSKLQKWSIKTKQIVFITLLGFIVLGTACSKKKDKAAPAECFHGLNTYSCGHELLDHSAWKDEFKLVYNKEDQGILREVYIKVVYQFWFSEDGPAVKRTVFVTHSDKEDTWSMNQSGTIEELSESEIKMKFLSSSCDQIDGDSYVNIIQSPTVQNIYYLRNADSLKLSDTKISIKPNEHSGGVMDVIVGTIGSLITESISSAIKTSLRYIFTFGSVRQYLISGDHNMTKIEWPIKGDLKSTKGCFSFFGSYFIPTKNK